MNQPLRLARGEMLYSDVGHIYGPLSPYLNSWLYMLLGPDLSTLYVNGAISAVIIILLTYWVARQLMPRAASTAAALSVTWMCAFKQAGNYILPYAYSAVNGCALGLISLAFLIRFAQASTLAPEADDASRPSTASGGNSTTQAAEKKTGRVAAYYLFAAGVFAGLAVLAKTEMGLAAIIAGVAAVALVSFPSWARAARLAALFIMPAAILVIGIYAFIADRVGWETLSKESFLFLQNLPPELVYFNKRISGFDNLWPSVIQMLTAALRFAALAVILGATSLLIIRRQEEKASAPGPTSPPQGRQPKASKRLPQQSQAGHANLWIALSVSLVIFTLLPLAGQMSWEQGPYLGMPVILSVLIIAALVRYQKQVVEFGRPDRTTVVLLIVAAYALASLARVILRVRSGGAYSSYLLPAAVVLFTYLLYAKSWAHPFAGLIRDSRARQLAGNLILSIIFVWVTVTAVVITVRFNRYNTYPLVTERGTMMVVPDLGRAFDEAIQFIHEQTAPGEPVAVMPEGTSLNFFTGRPNPLREEITTPGFLGEQAEERAIRQLENSNTRVLLVTNRPTVEFGPVFFGVDYNRRLMQWVEENFEQHAVFGLNHNPDLKVGDRTFFIRAYVKREGSPTGKDKSRALAAPGNLANAAR